MEGENGSGPLWRAILTTLQQFKRPHEIMSAPAGLRLIWWSLPSMQETLGSLQSTAGNWACRCTPVIQHLGSEGMRVNSRLALAIQEVLSLGYMRSILKNNTEQNNNDNKNCLKQYAENANACLRVFI